MSRSRNPPPKGQGAARAKQVSVGGDEQNVQKYIIEHKQIHLIKINVITIFSFLILTQMGLLLDLAPDGGLDDSGGNEEELEAELLALMGGGGRGGPAGKKGGGKGKDRHLLGGCKRRDLVTFLKRSPCFQCPWRTLSGWQRCV